MPSTNFPAHGRWPGDEGVGWAVAVDALAGAGMVAGAATAKRHLRDGIAAALSGRFADWVLVDLFQPGRDRRSAAARRPDPELAAALARLSPRDCPLVMSAMQRRTPVIRTSPPDPAELGLLPDGRAVLDALRARSYAVSPIVSGGQALGAISIVRCRPKAYLSFLELGILSQIADVVAAAAARLSDRAVRRPGREGAFLAP